MQENHNEQPHQKAMKQRQGRSRGGGLLLGFLLGGIGLPIAQAQPMPVPAQPVTQPPIQTDPVEEVPEEVLRTDVITEARSPIDGTPLSASEYAALQAEIEQANQVTPEVAPKVRETVGLLKLRKLIKTVLPFIPIK